MRIETMTKGETFEVEFFDQLCFEDHEAFRKIIEGVNKSGKKQCIFKLEKLSSIDSAGLGMFVIAKEAGEKNGWLLSLKNPVGNVRNLLKLAKFDKFFAIEM